MAKTKIDDETGEISLQIAIELFAVNPRDVSFLNMNFKETVATKEDWEKIFKKNEITFR